MKNVTITDIAKVSGVSIKTVSRVLNGEANVRDATRDKVKSVATTLGYKPNMSARMLRAKGSFVIVHFHDNPNTDYLNKVYDGMHDVCKDAGYFAVAEPIDAPYTLNAAQYLKTFSVDGVILSPPLSDDITLIDLLEAESIPYVRLSPRTARGRSSECYIDDVKAAEAMTQILIDLGHDKIVFLAGPEIHGASRLRLQGFQNAIANRGLDEKDCHILPGDFSVKSGFEHCEKLFAGPRKASAIFAANDDMAIGATMAALKAGLDVPDDISIAGFDGSRLGDILWPKLTTIYQPIKDMSKAVTEALLSEIKQPNNNKVSQNFEIDILVRGTTAKPPM